VLTPDLTILNTVHYGMPEIICVYCLLNIYVPFIALTVTLSLDILSVFYRQDTKAQGTQLSDTARI